MILRKTLGIGYILAFFWGCAMSMVGLLGLALFFTVISSGRASFGLFIWSLMCLASGVACYFGAMDLAEGLSPKFGSFILILGASFSALAISTYLPTLAVFMWILLLVVASVSVAFESRLR